MFLSFNISLTFDGTTAGCATIELVKYARYLNTSLNYRSFLSFLCVTGDINVNDLFALKHFMLNCFILLMGESSGLAKFARSPYPSHMAPEWSCLQDLFGIRENNQTLARGC